MFCALQCHSILFLQLIVVGGGGGGVNADCARSLSHICFVNFICHVFYRGGNTSVSQLILIHVY